MELLETVRPDDPVQKIMMWPVATVEGTANLTEAAEELAADDVGALLVLEHGVLSGVISERDVVRHVAEHADPDHLEVRDVMSVDLVTATSSDTIISASPLAYERRAPPAGGGREMIAGMVSARDVLGVLADAAEREPQVVIVDSGTRLVVRAR